MVRAPYTARIAAGLVVTALEEGRKLPTLVVTFPMTAVSEALQFGMRMQQNIAELAIKGDTALEQIFDKPEDQPAWATFDEDDSSDAAPAEFVAPKAPAATAPVTTPDSSADDAKTPETKTPEPKTPEPKTTAAKTSAAKPSAAKTGATKTGTAKTGAAKKAPAKKAPTKKVSAAGESAENTSTGTDTSGGRFALYSSAPEGVAGSTKAASDSPAFDGPVPEVVEYIEYDALTLAQLRAKLRSVEVDDLEALVAYERATKARAPFVTMLENRISAQSKRQS